MKIHFCAAGADIIWHAMKAFFSFASFSCNKTLRDVNLRECFPFFQHNFGRVKVQCNEIDAFYYYWLPFGHAIRFSAIIYFEIHGWENKFLIDPPIVLHSNVLMFAVDPPTLALFCAIAFHSH
jgi:hypothetical protein